MSLGFFSALDPTSEKSGITYAMSGEAALQDQEMLDMTMPEAFKLAWQKEESLPSRVASLYHVLVGTHYDFDLKGREDNKGGVKGIIDYLIFPLISRKLIADTYLPERQESGLINAVAFIVAAPLEAMRFALALFLTILLTPVVAMAHWIKSGSTKPSGTNEADKPNNTLFAPSPGPTSAHVRDIPGDVAAMFTAPEEPKEPEELVTINIKALKKIDFATLDNRIQCNGEWSDEEPMKVSISLPAGAADEIKAKLCTHDDITRVGEEQTEAGRNYYSQQAVSP